MRRSTENAGFSRWMLNTMLRRLLIAAAVLLVAPVAMTAPAAAQEDGSTSFLPPFPKGDVYAIAAIGDDMAEGLFYGLQETFAADARVQVRPKPISLNGLMRPDHDEKAVALEEDLKRDPPVVAALMLGAWDRVSLRTASGKRFPVGSPEWRQEYSQRADRLLKMMKRLNIAVYLFGLPNVRKWDANEDVQMMNEVLRERAYLNGMKFIDTYAGFLDENGGYSGWGPDLTGKIVKLRDGDGVYFTMAGNRKLAHFLERDLRRDLKQAQAARSVPLLGGEDEQAKINPGKAVVKTDDEGTGGASANVAGGGSATAAAGGGTPSQGDQAADNGRISLKTVTAGGREDVVTLDIVRPAIPASVVALVTRKESPDRASQLGDVLVDRIASGINVMSTFTPPSSAASGGTGRGRLSPTQSAYYRVLVKGERLAPRPGRADDFVWPRPEPQPIEIKPAFDPLETGSAEPPPAEEPPPAKKRRP
jgi:hypothetical protein